MSIEMQTAFNKDMAVIDENGNAQYVDNQQDIEEVVAEEIANNSNTVDFEEVIDEPKKEDAGQTEPEFIKEN